MKLHMNFKKQMLLLGLVSMLVLLAACGGGDDKTTDSEGGSSDEIVFANWGGSTEEIQMESWAEPYTEETGVKVVSDKVDYGKLKAMVDSGDVTWDVADVELDFAYQAAKEGLLEPIDFDIIDKDKLDEDLVSDHGVGIFSYAIVNAYNTNEDRKSTR